MTDPETVPSNDFASGLAHAQAYSMPVDHRLATAILLRTLDGSHATSMGDTSIWSLVRSIKAPPWKDLRLSADCVKRVCCRRKPVTCPIWSHSPQRVLPWQPS